MTAVLAGSVTGIISELAFGHSLFTGFATDGMVTVAVLAGLAWYRQRAWKVNLKESLDHPGEP